MFQLQAGYPKISKTDLNSACCMEEMFTLLYPEEDESFYVMWCDIPIRFRYRHELAKNFNEILTMLWTLNAESNGKLSVQIKNQLLTANLKIEWYDDSFILHPRFSTDISEYRKYVESLNRCQRVEFEKNQYLAEWHTLIHQVALSVNAANTEHFDDEELNRIERLNLVDQTIEGYGSLYHEHE